MLSRRLSRFVLFLVVTLQPVMLYANGLFLVSPLAKELKLNPGEEAVLELKIKNLSERRFATIYVFVNDLGTGLEPDNKSSLSSWINIPRFIEVHPGGEKEILLTITVNRLALLGKYSAEVIFVEAMDEAGARAAMDSGQKLLINTEVHKDIRRRLQINSFLPARNIFFEFPVLFPYDIENVGDIDLDIKGKIEIFNDNGDMVERVLLGDSPTLKPGERYSSELSLTEGIGRGKFKAVLTLDYGDSQTNESAEFSVLPWRKLGLIFLVSIALLLFMLNFFYKFYENSSE